MIPCGILTGYGINADRELASAFQAAGAETRFLHINDPVSYTHLTLPTN